MIEISGGQKQGLEHFKAEYPLVKGIFMGYRSTDPHAGM